MPVGEPGVPKKQLPPQQSALIVQTPPLATHVAAWQMPFTHGNWLQQSAEVAQVPPGFEQVALRKHRGMPSSSGPQHCSGWLLQVPDGTPFGSQQLLDTLHADTPASFAPTLQIPPGLVHEFSPWHRPRMPASGLAPSQISNFPSGLWYPQQSVLNSQTSACGLQPDGFSQIAIPPEAPLVPHDREQQPWSHA
jgi:hypothetical protein